MTSLPDNEDNRMKRLREAIVGQSDADLTALLPQIDAYVDAQLAGKDYVGLFPDVALKLDQSVELSEAYLRLYELAVAETALRQASEKVSVPAPDLSFLAPRLAERIEDVIERVGDSIRMRLTGALLPLLAPPASFVPVLRAAGNRRYTEHILHLDAELFTLDAYADSQTAGDGAESAESNCLLEVTVEPPGKAWPDLADSTVTIILGDQQHSQQTDSFGLASFAGLPTAALGTLELAIELSV